MRKSLINRQIIILLSAVLIGSFSFLSCSNNAPDISNAKLSLVFDYKSREALPQARLSLFVESLSNPRRFDSITVSASQNDFFWEANDLIIAADAENTYCGITNLVMPQNQEFPAGDYTIVFHQADEQEKEIKRYINYDKAIYKTKADDIPALMQKLSATKMLTVYDEEKKILYYGPRTVELRDARGIWNNYRDAREFGESWITPNGNIICNMPVEKVVPGN